MTVLGDIMTVIGEIWKINHDTQKILNFWSRMFEQYQKLSRTLDFYSSKNDFVKIKNRLKVDYGWTNYKLFRFFSDNEVVNSIVSNNSKEETVLSEEKSEFQMEQSQDEISVRLVTNSVCQMVWGVRFWWPSNFDAVSQIFDVWHQIFDMQH